MALEQYGSELRGSTYASFSKSKYYGITGAEAGRICGWGTVAVDEPYSQGQT